jgi:glycopeptide antibiotics resistance protein
MDPKVSFFFYLAATICFVLAMFGESWKYGARTRKGSVPLIVLLPLGLALVLFPTLWTTATVAW